MNIISPPRFYVYILCRPNGKPFYVGKGSGRRVFDHENEAHSGHQCHKCNVIRKIWRSGGQVLRYTVFTTNNEDEAYAYEQELIAQHGRENLTNGTAGGIGGRGRVVSQAERDFHRQHNKERTADPVWRDRQRQRRLADWSNPEYRAQQIKKTQAQWTDSAMRQRMGAAIRAALADSEYRARRIRSQVCAVCGCVFDTISSKARFCSRQCKKRSYRDRL